MSFDYNSLWQTSKDLLNEIALEEWEQKKWTQAEIRRSNNRTIGDLIRHHDSHNQKGKNAEAERIRRLKRDLTSKDPKVRSNAAKRLRGDDPLSLFVLAGRKKPKAAAPIKMSKPMARTNKESSFRHSQKPMRSNEPVEPKAKEQPQPAFIPSKPSLQQRKGEELNALYDQYEKHNKEIDSLRNEIDHHERNLDSLDSEKATARPSGFLDRHLDRKILKALNQKKIAHRRLTQLHQERENVRNQIQDLEGELGVAKR